MESVTASGRHGERIGMMQEGSCVTCGVICDLSFDHLSRCVAMRSPIAIAQRVTKENWKVK